MDYPGCVWPVCILCCSGGLHNIVYAFGFGYGLSMAANGVMASLNFDQTRFKSTSAIASRVGHICGYVAYGTRLFIYLYQRWGAASFSEKAADIQERSDKMSLLAKASITLFVGTLMATYHFGLYFHVMKSNRRPSPVTWLGMTTWILGLVIETSNDLFNKRNRYLLFRY
mmetsp:Transcript_15435/g.21489  ORF Transcript_15435/g.21489 Transcript_15435/m.21489 type:complete len:170 (+) Transcript_15435:215-724(+)